MAQRVLALTTDGHLTYCTAPEGKRGIGRCNHVEHQADGQSVTDFLAQVEDRMAIQCDDQQSGAGEAVYPKFVYNVKAHQEAVKLMPDNSGYVEDLADRFGIIDDPDWGEMLKNCKNPFVIGKESDGTYEEAKLVSVEQDKLGDDWGIKAVYEFRGVEYQCDFGRIPRVKPGGIITINGSNWRPLPVLSQRKAGVISYANTVVLTQDDGNVAVIIPKIGEADEFDGFVKIRGLPVPMDEVRNYLVNCDIGKLTGGQIWALDHLDPAIEERFPDWSSAKQMESLVHMKMDEDADLSYRRIIRYEDMVGQQYQIQLRRMGVTFRTNLAKRREAEEAGMSAAEMDEKYPLFYQKNLTSNITGDLVKRSNVQNAEMLNPIASLSQSQKISMTGPGGFNKDKVPYELRLPHASHEGIIDPLVASSGKNVGLTACVSGGYIGKDRYLHKKQNPEDELSPSDFIPFKYHDDPSRANMACAHLTQACPITGGEDPIVSTKAWDQIKGAKLGVNLKTVYISDKDMFEDAVKISESAAAKMTTVQSQQYRCYDKKALGGLQVGQRVERKTQIGNVEVKYGGLIKSVGPEGFEVETVYPMIAGDKISNRHGGKSVVSKVVPDAEMPHILDESTGKFVPAEIAMTTHGVSGRKNLGQVMECNQAAESTGLHVKTGKPDVDGASIERRSDVIAAGHKVEATAGVEYIMRLNHIASKKLQSHADEVSKSGESEGVRIGEMESILLSTDEDRLRILNYLRHQEAEPSHQKLNHLLKAVGVDMTGVNWNRR